MKETIGTEKCCADCAHYRAHYTKCKTYFCRLNMGHCPQRGIRNVDEGREACGKFEQRNEETQREEQTLSVLCKLERIERTLQGLLEVFSNRE